MMFIIGVPDPQEHHALIMARFATECQQKMAEITNELVVKLGPDTSGTLLSTNFYLVNHQLYS
jgi:hypothetical protein